MGYLAALDVLVARYRLLVCQVSTAIQDICDANAQDIVNTVEGEMVQWLSCHHCQLGSALILVTPLCYFVQRSLGEAGQKTQYVRCIFQVMNVVMFTSKCLHTRHALTTKLIEHLQKLQDQVLETHGRSLNTLAAEMGLR